jgi:hypothetical protein
MADAGAMGEVPGWLLFLKAQVEIKSYLGQRPHAERRPGSGIKGRHHEFAITIAGCPDSGAQENEERMSRELFVLSAFFPPLPST